MAVCGLTGQDVIESRYNINCPCLNCPGCDEAIGPWRSCPEAECAEIDENDEPCSVKCINCMKIGIHDWNQCR